LEHNADSGPQLRDILFAVVNIASIEVITPSTRAAVMVSFMRLRQRRKVDLPQPEGPIMAST